jgi:hypothetical protein
MQENRRRSSIEALVVFIIITGLAASLAGYLTFRVQFERKKELSESPSKEVSYQTLRIKEQERKQVHDHFHEITDDLSLEAWARKSNCLICHSPYPHGKSKKAKAIMNLHTEFMTCHSCHLKVEKKEQIRFEWINPTEFTPQDKPYGTSLDIETGMFAETDDHYSKLAPFLEVQGVWQPIASEQGIELAEQYIREKDSYSEEEKKEIEDTLHQGTELKEFIRCSYCHTKDGIMNFTALGFEAARLNQLEKMEIGGMLTNYDTFYFPEIFEEKFK